MILGNMRPDQSIDNIRNSSWRHFVFDSKASLSNVFFCEALANFRHLAIGQLGTAVSFAVRMSTLLAHIIHVVLLSAKPKMRGIHTGGIISAWAIMTNKQSVGDVAKVNNIGYARGVVSFSQPPRSPIAAIHLASLPQPAIVWPAPVDIDPKTVDVILALMMTDEIASWLTLHISALHIGNFRNGRSLTASTQTQSTRIGRRQIEMDSAVVITQKTHVLTFFCARAVISLRGNIARGIASTLTLAIFVTQAVLGNPFGIVSYVAGKIWGNIHFVVSPPETFGLIRRRVVSTLAGIFASTTPVIIPQEAAI